MSFFKRYYSFIIIIIFSSISIAVSQKSKNQLDSLSALLKKVERSNKIEISNIELEKVGEDFNIKYLELTNGLRLSKEEITGIINARETGDGGPPPGP